MADIISGPEIHRVELPSFDNPASNRRPMEPIEAAVEISFSMRFEGLWNRWINLRLQWNLRIGRL